MRRTQKLFMRTRGRVQTAFEVADLLEFAMTDSSEA